MGDNAAYTGGCFCGAVEIRAEGEPMTMGYCHCESCRHWSAAPVNTFTIWKSDAVTITRGAENVRTYNKTEISYRKSCMTCGGHLYLEHPSMGLADVRAAVLPGLAFKPAMHIFYAETVLPIKDGLPKFKDMPADAGGSGETMEE